MEAIREQRDGETVYVAKQWVQFLEDPDSVAAIVVSGCISVTSAPLTRVRPPRALPPTPFAPKLLLPTVSCGTSSGML